MPEFKKIEVVDKTVLRVIETDTLVFEYVLLPIVDLHTKYLGRFVEPITTIWAEMEPISLINVINIGGLEDSIRLRAWAAWYRYLDATPGEWPEEAKWLRKVSSIKLHECHIVRKETP